MTHYTRDNKNFRPLDYYTNTQVVNNSLYFDIFVSSSSVELKLDNGFMNYYYDMYIFYESQAEYDKIMTKINSMNDQENSYPTNIETKSDTQYLKHIFYLDMIKNKALILIIVVIISGINLFGTMVNSVFERKKEIGIKKALGASDSDVMLWFILENMLNVLISIIVALSFSSLLLLLYGLYQRHILFVNYIYVFYPETIIMFLIFAFSSTFGFSLIPAYKASQVNVVDTLRVD